MSCNNIEIVIEHPSKEALPEHHWNDIKYLLLRASESVVKMKMDLESLQELSKIGLPCLPRVKRLELHENPDAAVVKAGAVLELKKIDYSTWTPGLQEIEVDLRGITDGVSVQYVTEDGIICWECDYDIDEMLEFLGQGNVTDEYRSSSSCGSVASITLICSCTFQLNLNWWASLYPNVKSIKVISYCDSCRKSDSRSVRVAVDDCMDGSPEESRTDDVAGERLCENLPMELCSVLKNFLSSEQETKSRMGRILVSCCNDGSEISAAQEEQLASLTKLQDVKTAFRDISNVTVEFICKSS